MEICDSVSVKQIPGKGRGIVAARAIRRGERILAFSGRLVSMREIRNPNAALQIDEDLFLESDGALDENLNHSCRPNAYVDFQDLTLVGLRDISRGEEITFNYNLSEYDLVAQGCAFVCMCGSADCLGRVMGFKHLPVMSKREWRPYLSPFLEGKLSEELLDRVGRW